MSWEVEAIMISEIFSIDFVYSTFISSEMSLTMINLQEASVKLHIFLLKFKDVVIQVLCLLPASAQYRDSFFIVFFSRIAFQRLSLIMLS